MNEVYVHRERHRTLIIVEGFHEKNEMLNTLFLAFPEINIDMENVYIYSSNIYNLYNKIVKECGCDWMDQDIDLPMLVSRWNEEEQELSKDDFTNILLIFDYERHDPNFSSEIIEQLQNYFSDISDVGQLFINYPMVESYLDKDTLNFNIYKDKMFKTAIKTGKEYKKTVRNSFFCIIKDFPNRVSSIIEKETDDSESIKKAVESILKISEREDLNERIKENLIFLDEKKASELARSFEKKIIQMGYLDKGNNYYYYLREVFREIIISNIKKALYIQYDSDTIDAKEMKDMFFDEINMKDILYKQNEMSKDFANGQIWVLNMSILIAANYKDFWAE